MNRYPWQSFCISSVRDTRVFDLPIEGCSLWVLVCMQWYSTGGKGIPLPQSAGPVSNAPGGVPFSGRSIFNGRPGGRTGECDMEGNARLSGRYLHMSGIGMRQGRVHRFFVFIIITTASLREKDVYKRQFL